VLLLFVSCSFLCSFRFCIGVGASKCLGVRRIFAQISLNFPEKSSKKRDSISSHVGRIFKNQTALQASFLPKFPPNLPFPLTCLKRTKNMTSKKSTYSNFANLFTNFAGISTDFAQILSDFARIFTKSKFWGCGCTPCTPASYTNAFLA